ncbi:Gfo/Idh/MocA family protein [Marinifilum caeruleilacunae]|uniref:Gfo/Idh/MocA family oxidoreductase n=1 Tax=Marinifilum caeruleilacunae TaxID=2499076 RepID=A0ABX1WYW0_9BACT|nr:Gfo/Idh/MocA family oxidoreductase [Marinifilum caeruleilacunae]NOU61282.1 Gfo/Idh/MocA family oxidoreductase [Marinifilum caeruleilacunae]
MSNPISRRKFIGNISALGLASTLPFMSTFSFASDLSSPSNIVNVGIIGVGSRGKVLLLNIQKIQGIKIIAVCDNYDTNYKRAISLTRNTAKAYTDHRKLLENKDLDAVIIATPLHEHAHITIDALNSGLHVFCEKSMAKTAEDCNAMVSAALRNNKILQIGHQRLFDPMYHKAIEMIQNKQLGSLTQIRAFWHRNRDWRKPVPSPELERKINWRLYEEYSLGLMTELASHHLQVANWVYGAAPISVAGFGSINYWKDGRELFDNVNLVYKYPNGNHLVYDSLISNKHYGMEVQVMGDKGTLEMEKGNYFLEHPPAAPGILQLVNDIEKGIFETVPIGGASWVPETANKVKPTKYHQTQKGLPEPTELQFHSFANHIRENKIDEENLKHGYNSSICAIMGHKAMLENKVIEIPDNLRM